MGGKDLPTEVFIKKKLAFYQEKQKRRGGDPAKFVEAIRISPAEELAIFWNTAAHITPETARAHIKDFANLTPKLSITSPVIEELASSNVDREKVAKRSSLKRTASIDSSHSKAPSIAASTTSSFLSGWGTPKKSSTSDGGLEEYLNVEEGTDLDNPDELAVRCLLLGVLHRRLDMYEEADAFLRDAVAWGRVGGLRWNTWGWGCGGVRTCRKRFAGRWSSGSRLLPPSTVPIARGMAAAIPRSLALL
ncbi:hypothetical protein NMY22_g20233 [Coprinellus aureogranulatus]|nr:hypothetical protein NMY22_g20233 [Coprinellus aureogranulatus]